MATEKHILVEAYNGLHCLSLETGNTLWSFTGTYNGQEIREGVTPAVDQTNNFIYYQSLNRLWKLNALNGQVVDYVGVTDEGSVISGNTVLVNDTNGYYIACYYSAFRAYGGAVKVYDQNLDLVWEASGLNTFVKTSLCYHDGLLYIGTGDLFQYEYTHEWYDGELEQCRVIAYDITDGSVEWTFNPFPEALYIPNGNHGIGQVHYVNGYIIAFSDIGCGENYQGAKMWILNATTGEVVKSYEHSGRVGACGRPAVSYGRFFKGNLTTEATEVFQFGTGAKTDYAPFGTHKLNDSNADDTALSSLDENITYLGNVSGTISDGSQGGIIYDGKAFFCGNGNDGNVLCFDVETLEIVKEYDAGDIWDSSPMVVKNLADEDVLLVYRKVGKKVAAFDVTSGDLLWEVGDDGEIDGYLFFGFSYYESSYLTIENGNTSTQIKKAINDNFTALNALIDDAATLVSISTQQGAALLTAINGNISSLNTNGVAVDVDTIEIGMTGLQLNEIINDFVIAYKIANT
jgi:hypothetical protein